MAMPDDLTTLICLFHTEAQADGALKDLQSAGVPPAHITILGRKSPQAESYSDTPLSALGVPQKDLEHLQEGLRDGGVLLAVTAVGGDQKAVEDIFKNHKAGKIDDQRTDDYSNYKKYKPETQEHPAEFAAPPSAGSAQPITGAGDAFTAGSNSAASGTAFSTHTGAAAPAREEAFVEEGVLVDEESGIAVPARVVHIYRRLPDEL